MQRKVGAGTGKLQKTGGPRPAAAANPPRPGDATLRLGASVGTTQRPQLAGSWRPRGSEEESRLADLRLQLHEIQEGLAALHKEKARLAIAITDARHRGTRQDRAEVLEQRLALLENAKVREVDWAIPDYSELLSRCPKGQSVCSSVFAAAGIAGMQLVFHPSGNKDAQDGFCSIALRVPPGTKMSRVLFVGQQAYGPDTVRQPCEGYTNACPIVVPSAAARGTAADVIVVGVRNIQQFGWEADPALQQALFLGDAPPAEVNFALLRETRERRQKVEQEKIAESVRLEQERLRIEREASEKRKAEEEAARRQAAAAEAEQAAATLAAMQPAATVEDILVQSSLKATQQRAEAMAAEETLEAKAHREKKEKALAWLLEYQKKEREQQEEEEQQRRDRERAEREVQQEMERQQCAQEKSRNEQEARAEVERRAQAFAEQRRLEAERRRQEELEAQALEEEVQRQLLEEQRRQEEKKREAAERQRQWEEQRRRDEEEELLRQAEREKAKQDRRQRQEHLERLEEQRRNFQRAEEQRLKQAAQEDDMKKRKLEEARRQAAEVQRRKEAEEQQRREAAEQERKLELERERAEERKRAAAQAAEQDVGLGSTGITRFTASRPLRESGTTSRQPLSPTTQPSASDGDSGDEEVFQADKFRLTRANIGPASGSNLRAWAVAAAARNRGRAGFNAADDDDDDDDGSVDDDVDWMQRRQVQRVGGQASHAGPILPSSLPSMRSSGGSRGATSAARPGGGGAISPGGDDDSGSGSDVEPIFMRR